MSRRRRRTEQGNPPPSPRTAAANTPNAQPIPDVLKAAVEKAADAAKNQLATKGRITAAALFVYGSLTAPETNTTTLVSLHWRDERQKEGTKRRIREKALMEGACVVVVLTVKDRTLSISGRTSTNIGVTASVDYAYQSDDRVVSRWELHWLNRPVPDYFLEGVFDKPAS